MPTTIDNGLEKKPILRWILLKTISKGGYKLKGKEDKKKTRP